MGIAIASCGLDQKIIRRKKDLSKVIDDEAKVLYDKKIASIFESASTNAKNRKLY